MGKFIRFYGKILFISVFMYVMYISMFPTIARDMDGLMGTTFNKIISNEVRDVTGSVKASIFGVKNGFDTFLDTAGKGNEVIIEE